MTNSIKDVCEDSQVILLVGSNPEEAHPVMGMRLRQAVERGAKLIVVDPREIGLAKKADIHLKLRHLRQIVGAHGVQRVVLVGFANQLVTQFQQRVAVGAAAGHQLKGKAVALA